MFLKVNVRKDCLILLSYFVCEIPSKVKRVAGDMDKMGEAHLQESIVKLLVILLLPYVLQSGR